MKLNMSTRSIAITGMLGAIAIVLGATGIGIFPVPGPAERATILHVPAILGGVVEGPIVGAFVGLIFGIFSFSTATSVMASDPLVAILPRILIGVVSYYIYALCGKNKNWGTALAAIAGTATNTVGFLGISVLRGYLPWQGAAISAVTHGIPEAILAVIIVVALVKALQKFKTSER